MDTPVPIESKLPDVGLSIFAVMTRLANEHGPSTSRRGSPIRLRPGSSSRPSPPQCRRRQSVRPDARRTRLREALAAKIHRLYGAEYDLSPS